MRVGRKIGIPLCLDCPLVPPNVERTLVFQNHSLKIAVLRPQYWPKDQKFICQYKMVYNCLNCHYLKNFSLNLWNYQCFLFFCNVWTIIILKYKNATNVANQENSPFFINAVYSYSVRMNVIFIIYMAVSYTYHISYHIHGVLITICNCRNE